MPKYETNHGNDVNETMVLCKCPKCNKLHKKLIYYTGKAKIPYFFCTNCKKNECYFDDIAYDPSCKTEDKHGKNFRQITSGKS